MFNQDYLNFFQEKAKLYSVYFYIFLIISFLKYIIQNKPLLNIKFYYHKLC